MASQLMSAEMKDPVSSQVECEMVMIQQYTPLVKRIAQKLLGRLPACVQLEDLIQAGMMGLLEAFKNYDATKGATFETYASIRIRGSMLDEVRRGDWAPRSVHRNTRKMAAAIREIENKTGRDARSYEVAKMLEMSMAAYHQLLQETYGSRMFAFQDIGLTEELMLDGTNLNTPHSLLEGLQQEYFKESIAKSIEGLPERDRLILALYYDEELTLKEIGEMLGVSESRISQIHRQAMSRLKIRLNV